MMLLIINVRDTEAIFGKKYKGGYDMFTNNREKVKSTPFSEFVCHASSKEKRKLLDKVIKERVAEQRALIKKAELCH